MCSLSFCSQHDTRQTSGVDFDTKRQYKSRQAGLNLSSKYSWLGDDEQCPLDRTNRQFPQQNQHRTLASSRAFVSHFRIAVDG
jgi:hypothetical protein